MGPVIVVQFKGKESIMKQNEFQEYAKMIMDRLVYPVLESKGEHYSNNNAFDNFVDGGFITGLYPEKYLMVLANKHWYSLMNDQRNVRERAIDIIVYMLLLIAYNDEQMEEQGVLDALLK